MTNHHICNQLSHYPLFQVGAEESDFVVQPMQWGYVPEWFKGSNPKSVGFSNNNARLEGLKQAKMYRNAIKKNRRCVIVCDGNEAQHNYKTNLGLIIFFMM